MTFFIISCLKNIFCHPSSDEELNFGQFDILCMSVALKTKMYTNLSGNWGVLFAPKNKFLAIFLILSIVNEKKLQI